MKKALLVSLLLLAVILAACTSQNTGSQEAKDKAQQPTAGGGSGLKPGQAGFQEFPLGAEKEVEGMTIAGVYFAPAEMEPKEKAGLTPAESDIHLEANITAAKNNKLGFGVGEFIPYLKVNYKIENLQTSEAQEGTFMPMNASDGAHYGANVKMGPAGKYKVTYTITAPQDYLLHTDKETGVSGRFWRKPIVVSWEFNYLPIKK